MTTHMAMDDREKLRIQDFSLCFFEAAAYLPPEAFNLHTPGYAHTTMVRFSDHRSAHLPSLLVVPAMQSISYDSDVPPLASVIAESHNRAH